MNWHILILLAFTYPMHLGAQDVLFYTQSTEFPNTPANNLQYGWSAPESHNPYQQSHGWSPSYCQQELIVSICQSWNEAQFAKEIERAINNCMACGYSREQAEDYIFEQHALYAFPKFIASIQQLDGYRSYIKELHHKLLNNQGKFYRFRKAIGCVNRGYIQLREIAERLYNEIIAQEKTEVAQQAAAQKKYQQDKAKLIRLKHDNVRATFDAQRDELMQESHEWHELSEIYAEEQIEDITRIERRIEALKVINGGHVVYTQQTYTVSSSAANLLQAAGGDSAHYTIHYGNQLQQVIHQECIDGIEHLATMHPSNMMHPYRQGIAQCFDAAREYNQAGLTSNAATISDFCWALLDCGMAIAEGAAEGVIGAVKDMAEHPVQTALCAVAGEYVLAYQLSKVLYTVADIGMTALSDSDKAWQKWDDYVAPVTQLIEALENKQISLRDALKGATQFAVQWKTQDKLLRGLGSICSTAKTKAIEFAKNNPLSTPQEYMVTSEGVILKTVSNRDGKVGNGGGNSDTSNKNIREKLEWTRHKSKHKPPKNVPWKEIVKQTKHGEAKYKPGIIIEELERYAWEHGVNVTSEKTWKVFKANEIIGAKNGNETCYMRIECSANTLHGHPILEEEAGKYLK